ncbi:hypothetical protein [Nostoc sp.]
MKHAQERHSSSIGYYLEKFYWQWFDHYRHSHNPSTGYMSAHLG